MAQTTYQVTLSTGGNVALTVTTDDPAEMKAGLAWAELAYKHLVDNKGNKAGQASNESVPEQQDAGAPICGIHHVAMVRQKGKYGDFWSCHERNADGSFCSYRPDRR